MPNTRRNELARLLAFIDQVIADAREIADNPNDECQWSALDFIDEFEEARQQMEAELSKLQ